MEINRQIGLVYVVWIWSRSLGNVVPNRASFLFCAAECYKRLLSVFSPCVLGGWCHTTLSVEILTNQSHHHTDGSQQNGKTNKKEPTQTSAGEAANAKAEVEFCLPLEPKLINFKIHFTLILQSKWLLTLIFSFLSVQMWSHVSN